MPMPAAQTETVYPSTPAAPINPPPVYTAMPKMPEIISEKKNVKNQEEEIKEAIEVIDEAIFHLDNAIRKISSASNWGFYDAFFEGGCISSLVKRDRMDEANREMSLANECVKKLKEELKDIENLEAVEVSELLSFMDIFFDNIFSDIMVQNKIAEVERKCKKARRQLETLKKDLKKRLEPKTISDTECEKKMGMDEEEDIKKAFDASNSAIEILKKSIPKFNKAIDSTSDDICMYFFGCLGFMLVENKVNALKSQLRASKQALDNLNKCLKLVNIDISNRSEYLKFIEESEDILSCDNTSFDRQACNVFRDAKKSCIKSISEIESIRNELKDMLVKKNIKY